MYLNNGSVCSDLDVSGLAHAYGLLRLPKMRELSGRKDLDKFHRSDIDTSAIKYANPALERKRSEVGIFSFPFRRDFLSTEVFR